MSDACKSGKYIGTIQKAACRKLVFVPNQICEYEGLYTQPDPSMRHAFQSVKLVTVVRVEPSDIWCLDCLALRNEVLVISDEYNSAWMIKADKNVPGCGCEKSTDQSLHIRLTSCDHYG
uniref:AlNc14C130G6932 protein n=1 Tax=Albugo laibachii Nc14 TaxID=890382 RepID=F0WK80_9STRA|nr:AlNc14C130G6932 [Albugo laibachii Nc14]|eukprot:CCA21683.1 AlNc14C130G6932 [Albugo laibachii Nc14]